MKFIQHVQDAFVDPLRRRNVLSRCIETLVPSGMVLPWFLTWWCVPVMLAILLGEFLLYEFVLEPLKLTGPYWERGPREGETFTKW